MRAEEVAVQTIQELLADTGVMAELRRRAAARGATVVLPEGDDDRILAAAAALRELALARPVLLGSPAALRRRLTVLGVDPGAFEIADPAEDPRREEIAARLFDRRREKGLTQGEAHVLAAEPLHFGAGMVASGAAGAMVAGAANPTGEVIRAGLYHFGLAGGIRVVSGAFLMIPPKDEAPARSLIFADAAVVPEPSEDDLVAIGLASAKTFRSLFDREARVACLSFSTKGSARHPAAERMARVAGRLAEEGLEADGELQFDAAYLPHVGEKKAPGSPVAGRADVLIFPGLDAANVGYKIAQRLGGWQAVGPLVQGLARPVFDLSRGCSASDVVNTAALAVLQGSGDVADEA